MTFAEAVALPTGSLVKAVQPCDNIEYTWVRTATDRAQALENGDGRVMVKRQDNHPDAQHLYLFAYASRLTLA